MNQCKHSEKCKNEVVPGLTICQEHREIRIKKARDFRKKNPDKVREYDKKKDKSRIREYNQKYHKEHAEQIKEQKRKYFQSFYPIHKDRIKAQNREWSKKNKKKQCDRVSRYRARKVNAFVAEVDRLSIFERDNWICQLCFRPIERTEKPKHPLSPSIDHIIPLSKGGTHEPSNVQCAHLVCNLKRNNKSVAEFQQIIQIGV